jgi:hypothetical protein
LPQLELLPDRAPPQGAQPWRPTGAIPPDFRNFGKFFDTSSWRPGDLILTRELQPDFVGRWIQKAQVKGGYAPDDSRWSHAAMYVGDGLTVCEATFSFKGGAHGVVLTQLWDYCFGDSAIRIRRPTSVSNRDAHLLVINAMTHLRKPYAFRQLIKLGFRALTGRGFWSSSVGPALFPAALVCSTLYADAFARLTRRVLGEQNNGHCTPAYLSQCSDFQDVQAEWLPIKP